MTIKANDFGFWILRLARASLCVFLCVLKRGLEGIFSSPLITPQPPSIVPLEEQPQFCDWKLNRNRHRWPPHACTIFNHCSGIQSWSFECPLLQPFFHRPWPTPLTPPLADPEALLWEGRGHINMHGSRRRACTGKKSSQHYSFFNFIIMLPIGIHFKFSKILGSAVCFICVIEVHRLKS